MDQPRGQGAMSSSSGTTVGPIEALNLVPPEILRYLIASTKPAKAIEFDTGMGLVNLADAYERLLRHDLEAKWRTELSRRKRVAIEDDISATRLSSVEERDQRQVLWASPSGTRDAGTDPFQRRRRLVHDSQRRRGQDRIQRPSEAHAPLDRQPPLPRRHARWHP